MKKLLLIVSTMAMSIVVLILHGLVGRLLYETYMMIQLNGFSETTEGIIASVMMVSLLIMLDSVLLNECID